MSYQSARALRPVALGTILAAFAAGIVVAVAISWWARGRESAPSIALTPPAVIEQHTSVTDVGPLVPDDGTVRERDGKAPRATIPNPFQRMPRGATPGPRSQPAVQATTASYVPYQALEADVHSPVVTREWVRRLRSSCAQRVEQEKNECERVADLVERMLANTRGVDEAWVSSMRDELERLFSSSTRAKDFSLREVTCNANGCILYWHSSDFADWKEAGNVLVTDLLEGSSFADFDLRNVERIGEFDPTTSIPWEMLVLKRRAAQP